MKKTTRKTRTAAKARSSRARGSALSEHKTAEQRRAGQFLELYGMVHFLFTEQKCPVLFEGRLAYIGCAGVCKEAFKRAIDRKVECNLLAMIDAHKPNAEIGNAPKNGEQKR